MKAFLTMQGPRGLTSLNIAPAQSSCLFPQAYVPGAFATVHTCYKNASAPKWQGGPQDRLDWLVQFGNKAAGGEGMEERLEVDAAVTHTIDDLYGYHALPAQEK